MALPQHSTTLPKSQRYVITCAQNATPPHKKFLLGLETYCKRVGAVLLVVPIRYQNPTSMLTEAHRDLDWWDESLVKYLYVGREKLCEGLQLLAHIKTRPTAQSPLSGFDSLTGVDSGIIAHPKIAFKTIPTPQSALPKIMVTTGACTVRNYTDSKEGRKGEHHHTYGAAVVEIEKSGIFHLRQIVATDSGAFQDLGLQVRGEKVREDCEIHALVMGDTHVDFVDPGVVNATFGKRGMVPVLRPRYVVWHDLLDFYSGSHHHRNDPFTKVAKRNMGRNDVMAEVERACAFVDDHSPPWATNVIVPSNHNEHFTRWMRETDWRDDPDNSEIYLETALMMVRGSEMVAGGADYPDPFAYWAKRKMKTASRTKYLRRGKSMMISGVEVGLHGDVGPHGARGSAKGLSSIGVRSVIGHSHSPQIVDGCYQVGTSSRLELEYSRGSPSGWLHTHAIIYRNGKRSLVSCIGKNWRLV